MQLTATCPVHPRHGQLVEDIRDYLSSTGKSARWFGLRVTDDPRLVPGLIRGQDYPAAVLLAVCERLVAYYEGRLACEQAQAFPSRLDA